MELVSKCNTKKCSTLLKIRTPTINNIKINTVLYINENGWKFPAPKYPYLKHSKILVNGFNSTILLYFAGIELIVYTTGVTYIKSCIPKDNNIVKSLYFVVIDENIIPKPKAKAAINNNKTGVSNNQ